MSKPLVVHGKFGVTLIGAAVARVIGWDVNVDNAVVKFGLQGMDLDGDSQNWLGKLSGWNDGKIDIEALWLNEILAANYLTGANFGFRPGLAGQGSGFFGFTATIGFIVPNFIVSNIRAGSKATDNTPATFKATLEVDGPITYPS